MHYVGLIGTPHGRSIFEKYPTLCAVSMPKRKSPLPTLPKVEYVGEVALDLGGVHGYKKVTLGFQPIISLSLFIVGAMWLPRRIRVL